MFNWLVGGSQPPKPKSKENQITEVTAQYLGAKRHPNGLEIPFNLAGVGQVCLVVTWAYDFPNRCPEFKFIGKGAMQHPIVGENGIIVRSLPCIERWGPLSDLYNVVKIIIDDIKMRPPTVYYPGERPVVIEKQAGEPLGCTFVDATVCLKSVAAGSAAERAGLGGLIGKKMLRVNNQSVSSTVAIKDRARDPYIVLSFQDDSPPPAYPACPEPVAKPEILFPPLPRDFGLDVKTTQDLQELSSDATALRTYFETLPFATRCKEISSEKLSKNAETESELMTLNKRLLEAAVTKENLKAQRDRLSAELAGLKSRADEIAAQTSKPYLVSILDAAITEAEKKSDALEQEISAGDTSKQDEYRKVRLEYHLCLEKKRSLETD